MIRHLLKIMVMVALGTASIPGLYSCGDGSNTQLANGGIGGTGITQGRVTNFGSIFVNGIEFNTDTTAFTIKHLDGTQDDLALGMVVRINGNSDAATATGSAVTLNYDSVIEGVINSNDVATNNTLGIMGQTVTVDVDTVYENRIDATALESLPINSKVEISGFTDGGGTVLATRIEVQSLVATSGELKVSGAVTAISGSRFQIGNLTIDASNIQTIPQQGTLVDVKGTLFSGTLLIAHSIEDEGDVVVAEDGEKVDIEGTITQALDTNDRFSLNGQIVDVSKTPLSGASSQFAIGRVAEVEGVMNNDILLAEEIELKAVPSERGKISGILGIGNVDASAGTVTLLGQTIHIDDNATIMEDDMGDGSTFSLDQLISSDYLEANVYQKNGILVASKLKLDHAPSSYNAELEGMPVNIDNSTIEIFSIRIDTSGVPYSFVNRQTEVSGNFVDGMLFATHIQ